MASRGHESELESWAVVLGLSNRTVELAKQLLQKTICRKVYSMSKPLLALYIASVATGEYIPLSLFISTTSTKLLIHTAVTRIPPKYVRFDARRLFGIELSVEKMIEVEVRGFCRLLKLDPLLCEVATCVALNTLSEVPHIIQGSYARYTLSVIRFVAKRLNTRVRVPYFLPYNKRFSWPVFRKTEKYVDACVERARRLVAMQPP